MKIKLKTGFLIPALLIGAISTLSQSNGGIDPEALIEHILSVEAAQRAEIQDVVFDTEMIEGSINKQGELEEKARFIKKVFVKYLPDTALYFEEYVEYFENGVRKDEKKRASEARKRIEQRIKRRTRDISFPMLKPFYPENRESYDIQYVGVAEERIESYVCHHFSVTSLVKERGYVDGDYYFEADAFNLVRVDFSPAKLTKKMMFKLKKLDMVVVYMPTDDGIWLPSRFEIEGKGKAAFFFGVNFAGVEYFKNPRINTGLSVEMFEVASGD